jgi:hypothetical protein
MRGSERKAVLSTRVNLGQIGLWVALISGIATTASGQGTPVPR